MANAPTRARAFHAFCTGMPKTGTTSIGTIFQNYRSAKSAGSALEQLGCDRRDQRVDEEAVRAFVLRREADAPLEMNASSANWMIEDVLRAEFPDAVFIRTIRDCYSWCDSMINVLIAREIGNDFLEDPALVMRLIGCELEWFRDEDAVRAHSEAILANLLQFWANQSKETAEQARASRTLVLRTHEISSSLPAMAALVGVPVETLLPERSHSRRTERKLGLLHGMDRALVEHAFAPHAESAFMREWYPSSSLAEFLRAPARAPVRAVFPDAAPARPAAGPTARDEAGEKDPAARFESLEGHREIADAVRVVRALAERDIPERFGFRLESWKLIEAYATCRALLVFASGDRALMLEIGVRTEHAPHWIASDRFTLSYRQNTPAKLPSEQDLAKTLLDAVERDVRVAEAPARTS